MDDLAKLLPTIFRLVHLLPRAKELLALLEPAIAEWRRVAPEAIPLIRQLIALLSPAIRETIAIWPVAGPIMKELIEGAIPDIAGQWDRPDLPIAGDVEWIQTTLNKLGADPPLEVSGEYTIEVRDAVQAFQQEHGIAPDGWAGMITLAAMYAEVRKL